MEIPFPKAELKKIKKLAMKKYRQIYMEYIAEGLKVVYEALKCNVKISRLVISKNTKIIDQILNEIKRMAHDKAIPISIIDKKDFHYITTMDNPEGIMAIIEVKNYNQSGDTVFPAVYLDRINDPGNLGTIIRNLSWFGIPTVVTSADSVDILNPKVVRASMGAIFYINYIQNINFDTFIKKYFNNKTEIFLADTKGQDVSKVRVDNQNYVLVFGNESQGISESIKKYTDKKVTIPLFGSGESLNVGVASGIILYEFAKKLRRRY